MFAGVSMLVRYEAGMKMPSASAAMLFAVPSSTSGCRHGPFMPAALNCFCSVTFGAPPAVENTTASGLPLRILQMIAVQSDRIHRLIFVADHLAALLLDVAPW